MMEGSYERELSYTKEKNGVKLGRRDERMARIDRSGLYVTRDRTTTTMIEIPRAADMGLRRSCTASFPFRLVDIFKLSAIKCFSNSCAR